MAVKIKLRGVEAELKNLNAGSILFINRALRARVFSALGDLQRATPVDTGRARNSWKATKSARDFGNNLPAGAAASALLNPPSSTRLETFYITNGVPYIDQLNAGSSKQAPSRFIETTINKYFDVAGLVYVEV